MYLIVVNLFKVINFNADSFLEYKGHGGSSIKKRFLYKLIKKRKPDMVFIQETKMESLDRSVVQRTFGVVITLSLHVQIRWGLRGVF